jgi:hypothetical protein
MYNSKELEIMDNLIKQYLEELMLGIDNFYL